MRARRTFRNRPLVWGVITVTLAVAFMGADGCGSDADSDPTPVQTFKITPAANATPPSSVTTTPSPAAPVSVTPASPSGEPIVIAGINSEFDVEEITAPAGSITVSFDNRDGGVIHNIHFFRGDDADGESIAETELEVGPLEQTLSFDVDPGEYFYQCDAHPTTMSGSMTVR